MRSFVIPAAIAAALITAPVAFAAETATGTVKSFNTMTHVLTLKDGISYTFPESYKAPALKAGERVSVIWEMKDGKHLASSVSLLK